MLRTSELSRKLHTLPIYEWNCVGRNIKDSSSFLVVVIPPHPCPSRCYQNNGCRECLESPGGEGGWHECRWSTALGQCVAPSYQSLQCVGGMCGAILQGSANTACPRPCSQFTQCSTCHTQPHCGWCSLDSAPVGGIGICSRGTLEGPLDGSCSSLDYTRVLDRLNLTAIQQQRKPPQGKLASASSLLEKATTWNYQSCPAENECLNGHHSCDPRSERCLDRPDGFECLCSDGYVSEGHICRPVCSQVKSEFYRKLFEFY